MIIDALLTHKLFIFLINAVGIYLSYVVYFKNRKPFANKLFVLMMISMFFWVDFAYFARVVDSSELSLLFLKIGWFVSPILFLLIYFFTLNLIKEEKKYKYLSKMVAVFGVGAAFITGLSDLVLKEVIFVNNNLEIVYGAAMIPFLCVICFLTCATLCPLSKKYFSISIQEKLKIQYFIIGLSLFYLANVIFNIIFPVFLENFRYYYLADYSTIIFLILTAYSITQRELMGIKTFFIQTLIIIISIIILAEIFVLSEDFVMQALKAGILIVFLYFGRVLIKSIKKEKETQKKLLVAHEKINEQMTQLSKMNEGLQEKVDEQTKEIKKAYEVEKTARIKLEELDKIKDEFITTAAHQLRTPLSATRWALKSFLNGTFKGKEQKEMLEKVYDTNNNLINIVGDLLDVSSIENKNFIYDLQKKDLSLLLKEVISTSIFLTKDKKINISFDDQIEDLPLIKFDRNKMSMALQNVMSNAVDYTLDGGTIDITLKKEDNQVVLEIRDSGIGIPEGDKEHIFDKFYRGKNAKKTETDRSGLGLYITKNIIEKHGGAIGIESKEGEGTKVVVRLPV